MLRREWKEIQRPLSVFSNTFKNYFDAISFESKFTSKTSGFIVLGIDILLTVAFYVKLLILGSKMV